MGKTSPSKRSSLPYFSQFVKRCKNEFPSLFLSLLSLHILILHAFISSQTDETKLRIFECAAAVVTAWKLFHFK